VPCTQCSFSATIALIMANYEHFSSSLDTQWANSSSLVRSCWSSLAATPVQTLTHTHTFTRTQTFTRTHHTEEQAQIHTHTHTHTHTARDTTRSTYSKPHTRICTCTNPHTCTCTCTCTCNRPHIHTRTYSHTHALTGKKAIVVKTFDEGTKDREFGHWYSESMNQNIA
jgi:hypothetical protein